VKAVDGVSFDVKPGETVAIVGESGSGKSVMTLSILKLLPQPPAYFPSGEIFFDGEDLLKMPESRLREIRGARISMIFQDPMTSLNPFLTVRRQLTEVLETHKGFSPREAVSRSVEMLTQVGIPDPEHWSGRYPHELSGGMRQRVMIGMALLCEPALLIADEPTTALDVTIQAQILSLIDELKKKSGMGLILVTHDLGVAAGMADRILVMYAGRIVEEGRAEEIFGSPKHPYTLGLLRSLPKIGGKKRAQLDPIPGSPPDLSHLPGGCAFAARCGFAVERCRSVAPERASVGGEHFSACHEVAKL
jgi:oligopeptide/dipeptide ABC transporter ATP-binding protein